MGMSQYVVEVVKEMPPSGIRKFFDLVAAMDDVISLGVGEPDFVTPWHIREACFYSLEKGYTMYTSNQGMPELRMEIVNYQKQWLGLEYDWKSEVLVTCGVSEAADLAFRALVAPGDEVLIPDPAYVSYAPCAQLTGGVPVYLTTTADNEFRLTPEELKKKVTKKSKFLILPYPNNPTGGIMEIEDLKALVDVIVENDLIVLSDEIYGELTYGGKHASIATLPGMRDRTIVVNGFSKAFAMTGWRVGFACGHPDIIGAMNKIHQYTMLCAPIMGQIAATEALRNGFPEKDHMVDNYNYRRKLVLKGLKEIGLDCFEPKGAFYVFPSIAITGMTSEEFSERLLQEEKVAVVPGTAFGPSGEGFIRACYAASVENLETALKRIGAFVNRNRIDR